MDKGRVDKWLRQQVFTLDETRGACKKIVCYHVAGGKRGSEIGAIKVPKKELGDEWIESTVSEIEALAHDDAEGVGSGLQTYILIPTFESGSDRNGPRCTFRIDGGGEDGDSVESEPATKTGLLSQMMRHNEALTRTVTMAFAQVSQTQRQMISRLAEHNEKLVEQRVTSFEMMEQLRSEELERSLMAKREETKQKMITDGFEKVTALAPIVVNRLAGKKVLPEKQTAMEAMIGSLIGTISMEQMEKLQAVLEPHQLAILLEVFSQIQKNEAGTKGNGSAPESGQ